MIVFLDSVIWSLQRAGGISLYWAELISGLQSRGDSSPVNIEFNHQNIIRRDYNDRITVAGTHRLISPTLARLSKCPIPRIDGSGTKDTIYHSSFFRPPKEKVSAEVVTIFDMIPEKFCRNAHQYLQAWIKRKAVARADAIICISQSTQSDMVNIISKAGQKKMAVVYLGVSDRFRPLTQSQLPISLTDIAPYVLFIGQRGGYKNFTAAVKAVGQNPNLSFVAVGGGPLSSDENELVAKVLKGRFDHIPACDEKLLNQLYNSAFCLLYPSSYEGFGLPVVEAMRAGCPVVALKTSSIPELVGDAFPLVDSEDPDALLDRIQALENRDERSNAIANGKLRSQLFTWDRCVQSTVDFYHSII